MLEEVSGKQDEMQLNGNGPNQPAVFIASSADQPTCQTLGSLHMETGLVLALTFLLHLFLTIRSSLVASIFSREFRDEQLRCIR